MYDKLKKGMDYLETLSKKSIVTVFQKTFVTFSGLLLISSLVLLVQKLPIVGWEQIIGQGTIEALNEISELGYNYISLFVIISFTFYYFKEYNENEAHDSINHLPITLLNVAIFFLINHPFNYQSNSSEIQVVSLEFFGASGVFGALLVSLISSKLYIYFITHKLYIRLPEQVPDMIVDSFLSIVPSFIIVLFWWVISTWFGINVVGIIKTIFSPLLNLTDSFFMAFLFPFLNRLLWFVGIHGGSVINSLLSPVTTIMDATNLELFNVGNSLQYTASGCFFSSYVWIGCFPLCLSLITSKNKKMKALGLACFITSIFNIEEPLIFGIPIVLNFTFLIPFILSGIIPSILSYVFIKLALIPTPILRIPWTVPAPLKAFLSTNNDIRAFLWILFMWLVLYALFSFFIRKIENKEEQ